MQTSYIMTTQLWSWNWKLRYKALEYEKHLTDLGAHCSPGFTKNSALQKELLTETDAGSAAVQVEQAK